MHDPKRDLFDLSCYLLFIRLIYQSFLFAFRYANVKTLHDEITFARLCGQLLFRNYCSA